MYVLYHSITLTPLRRVDKPKFTEYKVYMKNLLTTRDVVSALGGHAAIAELTGRSYNSASNWNTGTHFPPNTFVLMQRELAKQNKTAPDRLWRMLTKQNKTASDRLWRMMCAK